MVTQKRPIIYPLTVASICKRRTFAMAFSVSVGHANSGVKNLDLLKQLIIRNDFPALY